MHIEKFSATDMRSAMAAVKSELGPDAVILDTRNSNTGVDIFATAEYDANASLASMAGSAGLSAAEAGRLGSPGLQDPTLAELRHELTRMRQLFENEMAEMLWQDRGRRSTSLNEMQRLADDLGLGRRIARELIDAVPTSAGGADASALMQSLLEQRLPAYDTDILEQGGRIALVGPTGVGKTTTIAKLAARFALRHGRNQVALVSTDRFRVGAQEQLFTFGNLLGIPVQAATQAEDLQRSLEAFADRKLVLIDTAGMSQRDLEMAQQLSRLTQSAEGVSVHLVLSAIAQQQVITEALRCFADTGLCAAIITKIDEAASLGPVISALLGQQLPVSYLCGGQRVPEDLLAARPGLLLEKAMELQEQLTVAPARGQANA